MMPDPKPGDRIRITDGILAGYDAIVRYFNKDLGTVTAYIRGSTLEPHGRTFLTNKRGWVPIVLMEGEYEVYGDKSINISGSKP